jgi:hypothetical protein
MAITVGSYDGKTVETTGLSNDKATHFDGGLLLCERSQKWLILIARVNV